MDVINPDEISITAQCFKLDGPRIDGSWVAKFVVYPKEIIQKDQWNKLGELMSDQDVVVLGIKKR